MEKNKTYGLQVKPIEKISEDERKFNVLATNGRYWLIGGISKRDDVHYECMDKNGLWIGDVTHFAVLPK